MDAPPGFTPIFRNSPFLETIGPFYSRGTGAALSVGLRLAEKHCNARGAVHGGVLAAMCDVALGYATALSVTPPVRLVTASLHIDFAGSAKVGDWVESRVDVQRCGSTLAFANCYLIASERRLVHASAVFRVSEGEAK